LIYEQAIPVDGRLLISVKGWSCASWSPARCLESPRDPFVRSRSGLAAALVPPVGLEPTLPWGNL